MKAWSMMCALIIAAGAAAGFTTAQGEPPADSKKAAKAVDAAENAASTSPLDHFKALQGTWESGDDDKDGKPDMVLTYRTVSAGSAVIENLFPGTEHEMITMYFMEGDALMCTHYCALGNQPQLKMISHKDKTATFEAVGGCNVELGKGMYMGYFEYTFVDSDHLKTAWYSVQDGKRSEESHGGEFHRAAASASATK